MKNFLLLFVLIFVELTYASERVTMVCELDAIASGYVDKSYSVNLILNGDHLHNPDGSEGPFQRKVVYGDGRNYQFFFYDGVEFNYLSMDDAIGHNYDDCWNIGEVVEWSLNIGNVSCVMTKGWASEKNSRIGMKKPRNKK